MAKISNKIKIAAAGGLMALTVAMVTHFEGMSLNHIVMWLVY